MPFAFFFIIALLSCSLLCNIPAASGISPVPALQPNISALVLVIAYDRASHLRKTLRSISAATPPRLAPALPVYVSVDDNPRALRVIRAAKSERSVRDVWHHVTNDSSLSTRARISRHYHYALKKSFSLPNITHVLIFEDDLHAAPDALTYLYATLPRLHSTSPHTIVCASAWNDNGRAALPDPISLTSFFPGLGWALSRPLWALLSPQWPAATTADPALVTIGWDFWLRKLFTQHDWLSITPSPPRTRHTAVGANVNEAQRDSLYLPAATPSTNDPIDWANRIPLLNSNTLATRTQQRLDNGRLASSLPDAIAHAHCNPVLPFRREQFPAIAKDLGLWPVPRGHFRHTLFVRLPGSAQDILLFDVRRAAPFFRLPVPVDRPAQLTLRAERNQSCAAACSAQGLVCSPGGLEHLNDCQALQAFFKHSCRECAFETGSDLPAFVVPDAPLETRGACLVTETGLTRDGRLDCNGHFSWTQRACACVPPHTDNGIKDEL